MFIVIEIQKTKEATSAVSTAYDDVNIANQAYHTALSYAAVSTIPVHTVLMVNAHGDLLKVESYSH